MTLYRTFSEALLVADQAAPNGLKAWNGSNVSQRFDVYRNNVMVSLLDALETTFSVTAQLTGTDFFRAMARLYVLQSPPTTPVLAWYGETFPDFVAGFEPAASLPYLADVARLEFARLSCYHSADCHPMAPQALSRRLAEHNNSNSNADRDFDRNSQGSLSIVLAPSTRVVASAYPVLSIWSAHQAQNALCLSDIDLSQAQSVLLTRPAHDVQLDQVAPQAAQCVLQADQGVLGSDLLEEFDFDLPALLALLIEREAVVNLNNNTKGNQS